MKPAEAPTLSTSSSPASQEPQGSFRVRVSAKEAAQEEEAAEAALKAKQEEALKAKAKACVACVNTWPGQRLSKNRKNRSEDNVKGSPPLQRWD